MDEELITKEEYDRLCAYVETVYKAKGGVLGGLKRTAHSVLGEAERAHDSKIVDIMHDVIIESDSFEHVLSVAVLENAITKVRRCVGHT